MRTTVALKPFGLRPTSEPITPSAVATFPPIYGRTVPFQTLSSLCHLRNTSEPIFRFRFGVLNPPIDHRPVLSPSLSGYSTSEIRRPAIFQTYSHSFCLRLSAHPELFLSLSVLSFVKILLFLLATSVNESSPKGSEKNSDGGSTCAALRV